MTVRTNNSETPCTHEASKNKQFRNPLYRWSEQQSV